MLATSINFNQRAKWTPLAAIYLASRTDRILADAYNEKIYCTGFVSHPLEMFLERINLRLRETGRRESKRYFSPCVTFCPAKNLTLKPCMKITPFTMLIAILYFGVELFTGCVCLRRSCLQTEQSVWLLRSPNSARHSPQTRLRTLPRECGLVDS